MEYLFFKIKFWMFYTQISLAYTWLFWPVLLLLLWFAFWLGVRIERRRNKRQIMSQVGATRR